MYKKNVLRFANLITFMNILAEMTPLKDYATWLVTIL